MEQKTLSNWLKMISIGVGICGLIVYLVIFPSYGSSIVSEYPEFATRYWPWLIFLWVTGIPCYTVLVFGWKIAVNIGEDKSFSSDNAKYLKWIALLAAGDTTFFFLGNLVLLFTNMSHPSVTLFSLLVTFAGVSVTVAAAALSHLVQKAAVLQEQTDLTI